MSRLHISQTGDAEKSAKEAESLLKKKKKVHTRDSLFKFYFIILCVGALHVCLAVHHMNAVPWRPEDIGSLEPELWTDVSHHIGYWELELSLPHEQVCAPYLNHCPTSPVHKRDS